MQGTGEALPRNELPSVENFLRNLQHGRERKDLPYTQQVYTQIHGNGLQTLEVLGNYLVPTFAECGSINDAHKAFRKLEYRNETSWTSLVRVYAEYGDSEYAFDVFRNMQEHDVAPSRHTYLALARVCARRKYAQRGQDVHAQIVSEGLEVDEFLGNTLVDMYAKCGLLADAQGVFDVLPVQTVVSWNALIAGYAGHGFGEDALHCFEQMEFKGLSPNAITFLSILKAYGTLQAFDKSQEIYAEIAKEGYEGDYFIGSTLLDVYAKCGFLVEAQEVFDELPVRDVVAWTTLIAGYAEHGYGETALHFLDRMQVEGVTPNVITFLCGVKACSSIGGSERGYKMHYEIAIEGLARDFTIASSLVDMYAKCGSLAEAEDVFYELPSQDIVLWTALISGFAEHGHDKEVAKLLKQMQAEGVYPDATTLVGTLKACVSSGNLKLGQEIHAEIAKEGEEADPFVVNKLVDMYAKCGSLVEAQEVFDEQPVHDVIAWSALIAGYVEHELEEEALNCFADMQQEGILPDAFTYGSILKACGNLGELERGHEMFAKLVEEELEEDYFIGNILVNMYGKCGSRVDAQEVFDSMQLQDVVSWNALIEYSPSEDVLGCLQRMRVKGMAADVLTYVCSLKACSTWKDICVGLAIHAEVVKGGFDCDLVVGNLLVDMYIKCGSLPEASTLFDKLSDRDVVSWNTLIAGLAEQGRDGDALQCLNRMQSEGILLDATTCVSSLKACSNLQAIEKGQELHFIIAQEGFDSSLVIANALLDMYVECYSLVEAQEVFEVLLPVRDVVSWSTLIKGYSEQEESEMAFSLCKQMQEQGLLLGVVTFKSILRACSCSVALESLKRIDAQIRGPCGLESLEANLVTAVANAYAKCGSMVDAQQVSDVMQGRDLAGWNALITGYVRQGETDRAFHTFERMEKERVQPDKITFVCLLTACCHGGFVEKGQSYYEAMSRDYGIMPSSKHHNCMMDLLGRSGRLNEAAKMLEILSFEDDVVLWNTMLGACRNWGNAELGKQTFGQAMVLGEKSSAAFVLMADMCADFPVIEEGKDIFSQGELKSPEGPARFDLGSFELMSLVGLEYSHSLAGPGKKGRLVHT